MGGSGWVEAEVGVRPQQGSSEPAPAADALARVYLPEGHVVWPANRFALLRDGVEAYPAMIEAIRSAERSVRLETYQLVDDAVGDLFGRALAEAAERGVDVKVLYDALGSWGSRRAFFRALRKRGVDVRAFRPFSLTGGLARLIRRDHRKLLIVDDAVAFVGGVNIASHWAPKGEGDGWRDDVLRIEGPAVQALRRRFGASWRMEVRARLEDRSQAAIQPLHPPGDVEACVLSSRRSIHQAYLRAIARARSTVLIAAAYFIPDRKILGALKDAAARGVEVSLILAGQSDHPFLKHATRALYGRLLEWGIRIHEWHEGVLHTKTAVVDGIWGTLGSFNLERMSLRFNHEVNVVFADARWGRMLEDSFRGDCGRCHAVDLVSWRRRPLWRKVVERVCYLFRKVL